MLLVNCHRNRHRARQQIEIEFVVAVLEEHPLAAIAALRHVVWDAGKDDAGKAGHRLRLVSLAAG